MISNPNFISLENLFLPFETLILEIKKSFFTKLKEIEFIFVLGKVLIKEKDSLLQICYFII